MLLQAPNLLAEPDGEPEWQWRSRFVVKEASFDAIPAGLGRSLIGERNCRRFPRLECCGPCHGSELRPPITDVQLPPQPF